MNAVSGNFTYPPQNSNLKFDFRDSIVASWVTDDFYATQGVLTLWYYITDAPANWTLSGVIEAVPANGSKSVALDVGTTSDFLGQFNINYNTNDGIQQKYDSAIFNVVHDLGEISQTMTWNLQALSTTSSGSPTPSKLQAASTHGSMTTSTTPSALTITGPSKTSYPNPHLAAAIGLGVGIPFGIAMICLIGFLIWKKTKSDRRRSQAASQTPATFVKGEKIMGELDAHQRHLELSVGRIDAELDASRSTL
ncbi:hypothetical protein HO133_003569 [Letharia lupina]|uniref:Uncharacterized protein n=1 Tax=Letharia lupina TaxID=560253 RepID=A0A8H6CAM1_9LECA|nr:uncharacterized protein HO133_003569 [Letharia lupina]KAF6219744.1 hypothetical protein HO133_003569 [Letharia lupina]